MAQAVEAYRAEQAKHPGIPHCGLQKICHEFEQIHLQATGKIIGLSYSTSARLASGKWSLTEASNEKSWLTTTEIEHVIAYAEELADRGFPLSHQWLHEHVNEICCTRLRDGFSGVGKQWTHHFVVKYATRLKVSWSRALDSKRGQAVNPHTHKAWFDLLQHIYKEFNLDEECIFAADETGISPDSGDRERVIGRRKPGPQYQQHTGNRENITIIIAICADGSAEPPAVILKGNAYQVKWKQDNPMNAS